MESAGGLPLTHRAPLLFSPLCSSVSSWHHCMSLTLCFLPSVDVLHILSPTLCTFLQASQASKLHECPYQPAQCLLLVVVLLPTVVRYFPLTSTHISKLNNKKWMKNQHDRQNIRSAIEGQVSSVPGHWKHQRFVSTEIQQCNGSSQVPTPTNI